MQRKSEFNGFQSCFQSCSPVYAVSLSSFDFICSHFIRFQLVERKCFSVEERKKVMRNIKLKWEKNVLYKIQSKSLNFLRGQTEFCFLWYALLECTKIPRRSWFYDFNLYGIHFISLARKLFPFSFLKLFLSVNIFEKENFRFLNCFYLWIEEALSIFLFWNCFFL